MKNRQIDTKDKVNQRHLQKNATAGADLTKKVLLVGSPRKLQWSSPKIISRNAAGVLQKKTTRHAGQEGTNMS